MIISKIRVTQLRMVLATVESQPNAKTFFAAGRILKMNVMEKKR